MERGGMNHPPCTVPLSGSLTLLPLSKRVIAVGPRTNQVHFLGWSDVWDEVMNRSSERVKKLHTFTTPWRQVRIMLWRLSRTSTLLKKNH